MSCAPKATGLGLTKVLEKASKWAGYSGLDQCPKEDDRPMRELGKTGVSMPVYQLSELKELKLIGKTACRLQLVLLPSGKPAVLKQYLQQACYADFLSGKVSHVS
jgi:hypothetical protein